MNNKQNVSHHVFDNIYAKTYRIIQKHALYNVTDQIENNVCNKLLKQIWEHVALNIQAQLYGKYKP